LFKLAREMRGVKLLVELKKLSNTKGSAHLVSDEVEKRV